MQVSLAWLGRALILALVLLADRPANSQVAAAANYGSFTVGGSSNSYYAVQFTNNVTSYGAPNDVNTSDLVIYRSNVHENGSWFGAFNVVISFHPTSWGHFNGQIEKVMYQTGQGNPYNDPLGDIADGSLTSGGNDLIVWLKGGATYHWRNRETTAGWSLANGNTSGGSITDSSGTTRSPIASQSYLIVNSKNNLFTYSIGMGTANNLYVAGNTGLGTNSPSARLEVNGNAQIDGSLNVGSGGIVFPNGGGVQTVAYTGIACGGDYAESVDVAGEPAGYEPGDVLVLTSNDRGDVKRSSEPYSTLVAGIYSTKPGTVGRRQTTAKTSTEIPMAMVGIVPTKVSAENGPIHRGDLLVTASLEGYAMKGTDRTRMLGAVVGKAMGNLESGNGVIEVLVTLQ